MIQRLLILGVVMVFFSCNNTPKLLLNQTKGKALGTSFKIKFIDTLSYDFTKSYDSLVQDVNNSISTYIKDSDISKVNIGDTTVVIDQYFKDVFSVSKKIYEETSGAFDPTIGVLVNAWDFGPTGEIKSLDSLKVDSLLTSVGLDKVQLKGRKIYKQHQQTFLDFNALGKGYMVDVIADFLEQKGIRDYLVEIGGEIRVRGSNLMKETPWKIGIEDPNFDGTQSYSKIISLNDVAMATSGGYRKYKIDASGNRYIHILDTKTGYPLKSNLLSVSVITKKCMEADAYATAFMSMGLERSQEFLSHHPEIKAYFIYENSHNKLETRSLNGFPES